MASTIAAITTGSGGIVQTADASGNLSLIAGSTTAIAMTSDGGVTIGVLAGSGSRTVTASATGLLSASSDSSLKEEVQNVSIPGLNEVLQLTPRAYKWLDDISRRGDQAAIEIGFFADQVAQIIPSAAPMIADGRYGFYDRSVTAALVKSVQELKVIIDQQYTRITELEGAHKCQA